MTKLIAFLAEEILYYPAACWPDTPLTPLFQKWFMWAVRYRELTTN